MSKPTMAYIHRIKMKPLKTFKELCANFIAMVSNICLGAARIDFVFDSYLDGSKKICKGQEEWVFDLRSKTHAIDLNSVNLTTALSVDINAL